MLPKILAINILKDPDKDHSEIIRRSFKDPLKILAISLRILRKIFQIKILRIF